MFSDYKSDSDYRDPMEIKISQITLVYLSQQNMPKKINYISYFQYAEMA